MDPVSATITVVKVANSIHKMNEDRSRQKLAATELQSDPRAISLAKEDQINEVLLVLATLGERLMVLGVINARYFPSTHADAVSAMRSCGRAGVLERFEKLEPELQWVIIAALALCATCHPMHIYRGFGAGVFTDWIWGCPDMEYVEKNRPKVGLFKKKPEAQPNHDVLIAFDRTIAFLQSKSKDLLIKQPSGIARLHPRFGPAEKSEVKKNLSTLHDWSKALDKRGHPPPKGEALPVSNWDVPFATWTSLFTCQKQNKDWDKVVYLQMDPGRILHAFICGGHLDLPPNELLALPPGSPAESFALWLEGLSDTTHKVIRWQDFDTDKFESKISKDLRKKIGQDPIPHCFAIHDSQAMQRYALKRQQSAPMQLQHMTPPTSPPSYSVLSSPADGTPISPDMPQGYFSKPGSPLSDFQHANSFPLAATSSLHRKPGETPLPPAGGGVTGQQVLKGGFAVGKGAWNVANALGGGGC